MSEPAGDKITFLAVPGAYKTGENVLVTYEVEPNFETNPRDWVGVFCVGWTSSRDYYTFEWVTNDNIGGTGEAKHQVKFSGSRLPPEDGHFYQFCYVTRSGVVKGASRPFQFTKVLSGDCIGDLDDLVEVKEEDSLLFLRTRHEAQLSELQQKVEQLTTVNANAEASIMTAKTDRDGLKDKLDNALLQLEASQLEVGKLKDMVEAKEEQVQKMKEKLETNEEQFEASQKEVGLLQMTVVGKEEEGQGFKDVISKVSTERDALKKTNEKLSRELEEKNVNTVIWKEEKAAMQKQLQELGNEITILIDNNKTLEYHEQSLRDKCNQLEQENRELLENKEVMESRLKYKESEATDSAHQIEVLKQQVISMEEEMDELAAELEKERKEKKNLIETARIKEQEANVAQENLCEVIGKVKEPKDLLNQQTGLENVDKSALEALQFAYTDVEKRWNQERKSTLRLKNKVAEMEERIKHCEREYMTKAEEAVELKKELKKNTRSPSTSVSEKTDGGSEATILLLQREYERLELELQEFQMKHDKRIDEKNAHIKQLEEQMEDRMREIDGRITQEEAMRKSIKSLRTHNDQLTAANAELQQKLDKEKRNRHQMVAPSPPYNPRYLPHRYEPPSQSRMHPPPQPTNTQHHRSHGTGGGRQCPVCNQNYPKSMALKDFELHVNSHF